MSEFNSEEKRRIDYLYASDFKDVTPADIPLIQKFEQFKAVNEARFKAEIDAIRTEADAKANEAHETAKLARDLLEERAQRSRERWEVLRNGK